MRITGTTRLAGIMGWPVAHSRSPVLHGFWLDETGIDGAYLPLPVQPQHIEQALRALPILGFRGCNLTIPHKRAALSVVDRVEPMARRIGAINTIVIRSDGSIEGRNTDADARVSEIRIVNRTLARAETLAHDLSTPEVRISIHSWDEAGAALRHAGLLVNATSLGMAGEPALPLDLSSLPPATPVVDIVYVPLETDLLTAARRRGHPVVDGLGMLLHQGRPGFEAWFGAPVRVTDKLRDAILATMAPER
jgi:shikimate dehydrogenase